MSLILRKIKRIIHLKVWPNKLASIDPLKNITNLNLEKPELKELNKKMNKNSEFVQDMVVLSKAILKM